MQVALFDATLVGLLINTDIATNTMSMSMSILLDNVSKKINSEQSTRIWKRKRGTKVFTHKSSLRTIVEMEIK